MIDIVGSTVTITKGDSVRLTIQIVNQRGETYTPEEGDQIRFALKKSYTDEQPILLKTIPTDTLELYITSQETKALQAGKKVGAYKYDIELTKTDGTVDTIIPRADFIVLEEVY